LCFASAVAVGQQVSVNYDHNASFANNANKTQNSILAQVAQ